MMAELDQLTPNYLTVNADGTIGAAFSGTIEAAGLYLQEGQLSNAQRVIWTTDGTPGGIPVAWVYGAQINPATDTLLADAGAKEVTIIDAAGASSFLQLPSARQLQIAEGSGTWTWPGGSTNSNVTTINHGLGRAPRRVLIEPTTAGNWVMHLTTNRGAVSFDTTAQFPSFSPGAGFGVNFDWIAIG